MTNTRKPGRPRVNDNEKTQPYTVSLTPSEADAIRKLGNGNLTTGIRKAIENMTTEIISRVAIYEHTAEFMKAKTPPEQQHISLVVSEESGGWYTADVGDLGDRAHLEAKGQQLIGKPIDSTTMFYNPEATYHLGTNPYASNILFPKE